MSASFTRWLREQSYRNDSVGDLARDARRDRCWPARRRSRHCFEYHLRFEHRACPNALLAFEKAYREWFTEIRSGQEYLAQGDVLKEAFILPGSLLPEVF